jgi:hypothetical protein
LFARLNRYARYACAPMAALALWAVLVATLPAAANAEETPTRTNARANDQDTAHRTARYVVVAPGDSLWSISEGQLGPSATGAQIARGVERIYALNRDLIGADPDLIFAGQRFALPREDQVGVARTVQGSAPEGARRSTAVRTDGQGHRERFGPSREVSRGRPRPRRSRGGHPPRRGGCTSCPRGGATDRWCVPEFARILPGWRARQDLVGSLEVDRCRRHRRQVRRSPAPRMGANPDLFGHGSLLDRPRDPALASHSSARARKASARKSSGAIRRCRPGGGARNHARARKTPG